MSPLSDQPFTLAVLAQFHREVLLPDVQRIVGEAETRLTGEIARVWDALLGTRERLETEYLLLKTGIARVEERLGRMDERLDR